MEPCQNPKLFQEKEERVLSKGNKGAKLELVGISKKFGNVQALDGLDLEIEPGELVSLLGPSGCGKTTALRLVAGLENPTGGEIRLNGDVINNLPASNRDMGMVFQSYSLFPNMTVSENIAYGLRVRKYSIEKRNKRVKKMIELVSLGEKVNQYPHQLSGGQQQRVALARALAIEPTLLLLDEPLSALDAKVREQIREEIRGIQIELGMTTLFVTHDQEEAMSISDRVGVMSNGKLEQIGTPSKIYNSPKTPFVAKFVGSANRIPAELNGKDSVKIMNQNIKISENSAKLIEGRKVIALVRPESISLVSAEESNSLRGIIQIKSFLGPLTSLVCSAEGVPQLHINVLSKDVKKMEAGDKVNLKLNLDEVMVENE